MTKTLSVSAELERKHKSFGNQWNFYSLPPPPHFNKN